MLKRVAASLTAQIAGLAVAFADRFVLVGILLRTWGTDLYSDWATLLAAAGLVTLGEMGLNVYFGNQWQKAHAAGEAARFQRLIGVSLSVYAAVGGVLAAAILLFAVTVDLTSVFSLGVLGRSEAALLFILLAGTALLRVLRGSISQIYRGRGQFATGLVVDLIPVGAGVVLVAVAALLGAPPVAAAFIYVLADLAFGWWVMVWDQRRRFPGLGYVFVLPTRLELKDLLSKAGGYAVLQGAPVAWLQAPVLMIGALGLSSGGALVSFVLARTLVNLTRQIATMVTLSVGVEIAAAHHAGDATVGARIVPPFGRYLSGAVGGIAGGLAILAAPLVTLWSGRPELVDTGLLLGLLAPAVLVTPALPFAAVLSYANLPGAAAIAGLVQLSAGLAAAAVLSAPFDIYGIVAGLALGEAVAFGILLPAFASRQMRLTERGYVLYLLSCVGPFAGAASWSALVSFAALRFCPSFTLAGFIAMVLVWGIFGMLPVLYLAAPRAYRSALRCWLRQAFRS